VSSVVDYRVRGAREAARFVYPPEILLPELHELRGTVDAVLAGPPGTEAECTYSNLEALDGGGNADEPVRFVAGTEWRLLGTYNALDAQRVFRFGQAIGRRFARVPVPTPSADEFRRALEPFTVGLDEWIADSIVGLYAAHKESLATELGPALFLRMPNYLQAARDTQHSAGVTGDLEPDAPADAKDDGPSDEAGPEDSGAVSVGGPALVGEQAQRALLAEAYTVNVGSWLSRLEPGELEALGRKVTMDRRLFSMSEWAWIRDMVRFLG